MPLVGCEGCELAESHTGVIIIPPAAVRPDNHPVASRFRAFLYSFITVIIL